MVMNLYPTCGQMAPY
jgi:Transposase IS4